MAIHPTAVVDEKAQLGADVKIGPFCVVEQDVVLGDGCVLEARAIIRNGSRLGSENHLFEGALVGGMPQHLQIPQRIGGVVLGNGNQIRENATIHCALHEGQNTVIGDGNMIMVNTHVAHDCVIGNNTVLINNTMVAGHVEVGDRAYVAGGSGIQQFRRVGRLATVGGQARVTKDVPPFVMLDGVNCAVVGLNKVGIRRAGYTPQEISEIREAYDLIFRSGLTWKEVCLRLPREFPQGPAAEFHAFISAGGKYGFATERRVPSHVTLPMSLANDDDQRPELRVQAG